MSWVLDEDEDLFGQTFLECTTWPDRHHIQGHRVPPAKTAGGRTPAVTAHRWRTGLVVQAREVERDTPVLVMVGLLQTAAGGVQLALRVGDHPPVILPLQDARQLATNLTTTITKRLAITTETLRDDPESRS